MSRSAKKIVYGFFYLVAFAFIGFFLYGIFLKSSPTCFDKIQNQGETGVDCGGPCGPCSIRGLMPLRILSVSFWGTISGRTAILADVSNPNPNYGAATDYQFSIEDKSGRVVETTPLGLVVFGPSAEIHIFSADVTTNFNNINQISIDFPHPNWQPGTNFLSKPNFTYSGLKTALVGQSIQVTGMVLNPSSQKVDNLKIIALLFNKLNIPIFASQTLTSFAGSNEASFTVNFPSDPNLNTNFDAQATQIIFESQ